MIQRECSKIGLGGEILSADVTIIKKIKAEEYCQLYIKDDSEYYRLTKSEANVLSVCIYQSAYYDDDSHDYPGNIVHCDGMFKEVALERTKLKEGTIKNTLSSLVKKEMLLKDPKHKGIYYLNPKYFFKGTISRRTQCIEKTIKYVQEDEYLEIENEIKGKDDV